MKLASKFAPKCPSCRRALPRNTFGPGYDMPWACLKCRAPICVWCYSDHTAECCPDLNVCEGCLNALRDPMGLYVCPEHGAESEWASQQAKR